MSKHNFSAVLTVVPLLLLLLAPVAAVAETSGAVATPSAAAAVTSSPEQPKAEPAAKVQPFRVGYADIRKIAEQSAAGKTAKADFEAKADKHKTQIETKQKSLEKQKATLEAKLPTYTPEQRKAKLKDYEKKVDELRKMLIKAEKEMKPMQEELTREIYGKIEKAAGEFGAANGFSVIVVKNDLLYLGNNVDVQDVTDALTKHLDGKKAD
jgi:outer membrane protein